MHKPSIKNFLRAALSATALAASAKASCSETIFNSENYDEYGDVFFVFEDAPNAVWMLGEIFPEDYFHFREALRENVVDTLILDSPGGDVYESLYIAASVHDLGMKTYIPFGAECVSACANIFLAGHPRAASGGLAVHQFVGDADAGGLTEEETLLTVSDIIKFLNDFETPPSVFERMFQSTELYYFNDIEIEAINRAPLFLAPLMDEYDQGFQLILNSSLYNSEPNEPDDGIANVQPDIDVSIYPGLLQSQISENSPFNAIFSLECLAPLAIELSGLGYFVASDAIRQFFFVPVEANAEGNPVWGYVNVGTFNPSSVVPRIIGGQLQGLDESVELGGLVLSSPRADGVYSWSGNGCTLEVGSL